MGSLTSGIQPPTTRLKSLVRDPSLQPASGFISLIRHNKPNVVLCPPRIDRKKVLKHHPDKKATIAGETNDDAFFKCIQKAMDVLTNPERRRQFDSVDPYYLSLEEDSPTAGELRGKDYDAFFKAFAPVFEREARFSKKKPVPLLTPFDASKEEVEGFYNFWYNFDSWRSFEYLDKEINEGSDKYGHVHHSHVLQRLTVNSPAETISGLRKRRIKRSELAGRRRTQPGCVVLWTLASAPTFV